MLFDFQRFKKVQKVWQTKKTQHSNKEKNKKLNIQKKKEDHIFKLKILKEISFFEN